MQVGLFFFWFVPILFVAAFRAQMGKKREKIATKIELSSSLAANEARIKDGPRFDGVICNLPLLLEAGSLLYHSYVRTRYPLLPIGWMLSVLVFTFFVRLFFYFCAQGTKKKWLYIASR